MPVARVRWPYTSRSAWSLRTCPPAGWELSRASKSPAVFTSSNSRIGAECVGPSRWVPAFGWRGVPSRRCLHDPRPPRPRRLCRSARRGGVSRTPVRLPPHRAARRLPSVRVSGWRDATMPNSCSMCGERTWQRQASRSSSSRASTTSRRSWRSSVLRTQRARASSLTTWFQARRNRVPPRPSRAGGRARFSSSDTPSSTSGRP